MRANLYCLAVSFKVIHFVISLSVQYGVIQYVISLDMLRVSFSMVLVALKRLIFSILMLIIWFVVSLDMKGDSLMLTYSPGQISPGPGLMIGHCQLLYQNSMMIGLLRKYKAISLFKLDNNLNVFNFSVWCQQMICKYKIKSEEPLTFIFLFC